MNMRRVAAIASALALSLAATSCGSDDNDLTPGDMSSSMSDHDMGDHSDGHGDHDDHGSMMNDPDATPADEVDGDVTSGDFVLLDTAPPGSEGVAGQAWLAQNDVGTTLTVRLTGLEPDTVYTGHLHALACEDSNGGDHFKFDPAGSDEPPNEVHVGFTSTADGTGEATVTNEAQVGDGAPSVVIHPADSMDNRLACADFS